MIRSLLLIVLVAVSLTLGYLCRNVGDQGGIALWVSSAASVLFFVSGIEDIVNDDPRETGLSTTLLGLFFALMSGAVLFMNDQWGSGFFRWPVGVLIGICGSVAVGLFIRHPEIEQSWRQRFLAAR